MTRALTTLLLLVVSVATATAGSLYLGWADEFFDGEVTCNTDNSGCTIKAYWAGPYWVNDQVNDKTAVPTWTFLGQQTNAGRSNAKAKVMFRFRKLTNTSSAFTVTVTLTRFRRTQIPAEGAKCDSADGLFGPSISRTVDVSGLTADDAMINNRLLPVSDFSYETARGGRTIGYRDNIAANFKGDWAASKNGCYKIT